jgi:hypothetical protein
MILRTVTTELGRFREVSKDDELGLEDRWVLECPDCGVEAYLDADQWDGRVSVNHGAQGCPGGYHETHDYRHSLASALLGDQP